MRIAKLLVLFTLIISCAFVSFGFTSPQSLNNDNNNTESMEKLGATVFERECTACHAGGNNTIENDKTLKLDALKKFGFNAPTDIHKRVEEGKGVMPVFKDSLKAEEIDAVANYVWTQAQKGWK